jgi:hypothetical protein
MKHLLSGVAIVAALTFAVPVWAQREGPGATAGTGTGPAVNPPGGPGPSSPLYNLPQGSPGIPGTPQSRYPGSPAGAAAGVVPGVAVPGLPGPGATTSAEPPAHRHARASTHHHGMAAHPPSQMTGGTAAQLNQEELARVASGNFSMPPAPPGPGPSAAPPTSTNSEAGPGRASRRARQ